MTTDVTIHGEHFKGPGYIAPSVIHLGPTNGPTNVTNIVVVSDKIITCTLPGKDPAWPSDVGLWITTPYGVGVRPNAFHYNPAPIPPFFHITSSLPITGINTGGTPLVILGQKFSNVVSGDLLLWGDLVPNPLLDLTIISDTEIHATTPAGVAFNPYLLRLTNANGDIVYFGTSTPFSPAFTYQGSPRASFDSITPNFGSYAGGYSVFIHGTGFVSYPPSSLAWQALFGLTYVVNSDTEIQIVSWPTGDALQVTQSTLAGLVWGYVGASPSVSVAFTFDDFVGTITPYEIPAAGGLTITVSGTSLDYTDALTVGGVGTAFVIVDAHTLTFVAPAHAVGPVDVVISSINGANEGVFVFTCRLTYA